MTSTDNQIETSNPDHFKEHRARVKPLDVLVVDDQRQSRMVLETILQHMGHRPTGCAHAESAFERLEKHEFQVVLADVHMPGMGGMELLDILAQDYPNLPVVLVTADENVIAKCQHRGSPICRVLIKPVYPKALCAMIESLQIQAPS